MLIRGGWIVLIRKMFDNMNLLCLDSIFEFSGGPLAQLAEQRPFKARVDGSNPSRLTIISY